MRGILHAARLAELAILLCCYLFTAVMANQGSSSRAIGVMGSAAATTSEGGQRWALVVGINDYHNVPALAYARQDALAVRDVLVGNGYPAEHIMLMTDQAIGPLLPTLGNLRSRINDIAVMAGEKDAVLVYFSGHGTERRGAGYLVPIDGRTNDPSTLVPLSWVKTTIETSAAKHRLLVLDACHSGARAGDAGASPAQAMLAVLDGAAFATLSSCDASQLSHEDRTSGHGVFTDALVEGLAGRSDVEAQGNGDGIITANELWAYSALRVKEWTVQSGKIQTPVLEGSFQGLIEVTRFKTTAELKAQREELQERLRTMETMERTGAAEELKKEIARLEAQLDAIAGPLPEGLAGSDDIKMAYARFDAAEKQVAEIEALLAKTLKTYRPTSQAVATVKARLEQSQAELTEATEAKRAADARVHALLESQIKTKTTAYERLIQEVLPSAPQARKVQQEIKTLRERQSRYAYAIREVQVNSIGMKFVQISPGEFVMGSPDSEQGRDSDEGPQHRVRLTNGFYLGVYEVTQGQWQAVMESNPSRFKGDDLPVENVSWEEAVGFCNRLSEREGLRPYYVPVVIDRGSGGVLGLGRRARRTGFDIDPHSDGYRFPTEAEWEYACRAGTVSRYGFGDSESSLGGYAWYDQNSGSQTHPVGQKRPNAWGLYDMHGNVWEWCHDWYGPYAGGSKTDPLGPAWGDGRVFRGGSWLGIARHCRSADRVRNAPVLQDDLLGFRLARTTPSYP